ncbi:phage tail tape measure protein [Streptomyces sp. E11-3]|uniref:phage tail tape measure protein n=1 Tax=Streptomyces sp. E11-3 TaxID=3110112 RepID=UPI003980343D
MAEEVGVAFVRLVPSMRGFGPEAQRALNDATRGPAAAAGQQAGGRFGGAFKTALLGAGVVAGAALIGGVTEALDQGRIIGKLRAQLGATPAEAEKYGKIAGSLYSNAVTQDFQGAADAISATMRAGLVPPGATNKQIESIATKVTDLSNTFELDLGQSANAVGQIMKTGLAPNAKTALDVMAKGLQGMGPRADDLADTFNEYSVQFQRLGLDATTATGLLSQGLKAGARDTDVVADALKEFTLEGVQGSDKIVGGFKAIGLNADKMVGMISEGGPKASEALQITLDTLRDMEDPVKRDAAAVELFGTKSEDMQKALLALDPSKATAELGRTAGAADGLGDSLRDNAGVKVEQFKRTLQQGFVEFLGSEVIPRVQTFVGFLRDNQDELKLFASVITAVVVPALLLLAGRAMWTGLQMAAAWVVALGPIGWIGLAIGALVVLVITYWDEIVSFTKTAWAAVWDFIKGIGRMLLDLFLNWTIVGLVIKHWSAIREKTSAAWRGIVDWLKGVPRMIYNAFLNFTPIGLMIKHWSAIKKAIVSKALEAVAWVKGLPGMIGRAIGSLHRLLYDKGRDVVRGLWNGIKGMGRWLRSTLVGWAKRIVPGPIAKALGISSPSKVMAKQVGRWIPAGIAEGWESGMGDVTAMGPATARAALPAAAVGQRTSAAAATPTVVLDAHGMPRALVEWLRNAIRTEAGGSAERFFKPAR